MSACRGAEQSGWPPASTGHPLCAPCGSRREGGDFSFSLVCCLDAFKRGQLEDAAGGSSSEPSPNGVSPAGASAAPDLEEIKGQTGVTGRRVRRKPWPGTGCH